MPPQLTLSTPSFTADANHDNYVPSTSLNPDDFMMHMPSFDIDLLHESVRDPADADVSVDDINTAADTMNNTTNTSAAHADAATAIAASADHPAASTSTAHVTSSISHSGPSRTTLFPHSSFSSRSGSSSQASSGYNSALGSDAEHLVGQARALAIQSPSLHRQISTRYLSSSASPSDTEFSSSSLHHPLSTSQTSVVSRMSRKRNEPPTEMEKRLNLMMEMLPTLNDRQASKKRRLDLSVAREESKRADLEFKHLNAQREHIRELARIEVEKLKVQQEQQQEQLRLKVRLAELEVEKLKLTKGQPVEHETTE
jgi:hypothetical protein